MTRVFLALVGGLYLYLSLWCSFRPAETARLVGFTLHPGSGKSEFLTVYGGLEFALAVLFLRPLWRADLGRSALETCFIVHAALVLFRTAGFFLFRDIEPMTYQLAAGEWVIFLAAAGLAVLGRPPQKEG